MPPSAAPPRHQQGAPNGVGARIKGHAQVSCGSLRCLGCQACRSPARWRCVPIAGRHGKARPDAHGGAVGLAGGGPKTARGGVPHPPAVVAATPADAAATTRHRHMAAHPPHPPPAGQWRRRRQRQRQRQRRWWRRRRRGTGCRSTSHAGGRLRDTRPRVWVASDGTDTAHPRHHVMMAGVYQYRGGHQRGHGPAHPTYSTHGHNRVALERGSDARRHVQVKSLLRHGRCIKKNDEPVPPPLDGQVIDHTDPLHATPPPPPSGRATPPTTHP